LKTIIKNMGACLDCRHSVDKADDSSFISYVDNSGSSKECITGFQSKRVVNSSEGFRISNIIFPSNFELDLSSQLFQSGSKTSSSVLYQVPITEVTSQIFIGAFEDAKDDEKLKELGITHIISLIGPKHPVEGMKLKHKPMSDYGRTDLKEVIRMLWSFILESQKPSNKLFVHCWSGQNRSATLVTAILMKLENGPNKLIDAYWMVKEKRPVVQIIEKYAQQLSALEIELFGVTTVPVDWMKIQFYNMETGQVVFQDERPKQKSKNLTIPGKLQDLGTKQYCLSSPDLPSSALNITVENEVSLPRDKNSSLSDPTLKLQKPTVSFGHLGNGLLSTESSYSTGDLLQFYNRKSRKGQPCIQFHKSVPKLGPKSSVRDTVTARKFCYPGGSDWHCINCQKVSLSQRTSIDHLQPNGQPTWRSESWSSRYETSV